MVWLRTHDEFLQMYRLAREDQADVLADEIIEIADEKAETSEAVQRNRLRVDARKWAASKLKPRRYGDRVAHTGPDDGSVKHQLPFILSIRMAATPTRTENKRASSSVSGDTVRPRQSRLGSNSGRVREPVGYLHISPSVCDQSLTVANAYFRPQAGPQGTNQ